jgi:type I restriction enzyme S subunit
VLIKPNKDRCSDSYLFNLCNSIIVEKQFQDGAKATTQAAFGIQKVRNLKIPLPLNLSEQTQIVQEIETRLSVCDKLNEAIEQSLEKAQALRQSILKKAFEGKLLSQDELQNCRQQPDWEPAAKLLERVQNKKNK